MPEKDEALIRSAVEAADPNVLRMALYQATRDESLLAMEVRHLAVRGGATTQAQLVPEYHAAVREKALAFLLSGAEPVSDPLPDDQIWQLMQNFANDTITEREFRYRKNFLSFEDYQFGVKWSRPDVRVPDGFKVVIVGAGFSGIAAAVQFQQLGIPYVVYEKRAEAGGVWSINTYPDARVDTSSFTYQFTFQKRHLWSEYYARGAEVRSYVERVARDHGIFDHIQFNTELKKAEFDAASGTWAIDLVHSDTGEAERIDANILVSATGLFGTPKKPDIKGIEGFTGTTVHTAQWPPAEPIDGKRVAVIGNGSTGVQLLSSVAAVADQVSVFHRTPQWIAPREGYGDPIPAPMRWLLAEMPFYWNWYCYLMFSVPVRTQGLHEYDRAWQAAGGQVSERNDNVRKTLTDYIKNSTDNRPELYEHLIPPYPPMTRRLIVDNNWYKTLLRPNVELVTEAIDTFTPTGIRTADGQEREIDVVITAIGFSVTKYLWPVQYVGLNGTKLEDVWATDDGPMAYLGITIPEFPNLFVMYGPNSQARTGSLPSWAEIWSRYIAQAVVNLIESGNKQISVKQDVYDKYNKDMDQVTLGLVWTDQTALKRNYWMHASGRSLTNAPWNVDELYEKLAEPDPADFIVQ